VSSPTQPVLQPNTRLMDTPEPTAGDLQGGIYALSGIIDVLYWFESEKMPRSDADLAEMRHELLNAAQLFCDDFKRRF